MKRIEISTYLTEVLDSDEKYIVREYRDDGTVSRTRVVQSQEAAENVKLEWQKLQAHLNYPTQYYRCKIKP
jgi:hypothetical protein